MVDHITRFRSLEGENLGFSQYVYFGSIFTVLGGVVCAMLLWPLERDAVVVGRSVMIILCATGAVGGGLIGVIIAKRYMKHIFR